MKRNKFLTICTIGIDYITIRENLFQNGHVVIMLIEDVAKRSLPHAGGAGRLKSLPMDYMMRFRFPSDLEQYPWFFQSLLLVMGAPVILFGHNRNFIQ